MWWWANTFWPVLDWKQRTDIFFIFKLTHSIVFCKSYTHSESFCCFHLAAGAFRLDTGQDNGHMNSSDPASIGLKNDSIWISICIYCLIFFIVFVFFSLFLVTVVWLSCDYCWLFNKLPLGDNKDTLNHLMSPEHSRTHLPLLNHENQSFNDIHRIEELAAVK